MTRDAIALTNITLGERLARAAVSSGGLDASEPLADPCCGRVKPPNPRKR